MGFVKSGLSAVGKFFIVLVLAAAFIVGLVSVVYMSLKGDEVQIPEIVGKDYKQSETELAALGLKIRRIANRYSTEPPNTVLEQRPRAGSTAKSGLMISVIVAQPNPEGSEAPAEVKKKGDDEESIEEIEDLISDKPKKNANKAVNSNKKKASTSRDVISNKSSDNSNSSDEGNSSSSKSNSAAPAGNKSTTPKPSTSPATDTKKPSETKKPNEPAKPNSGDTRQRKTP